MDDKHKFSGLIDKEKYQVFLLACPGSVPFNFALHPWFVVNRQGTIFRWEVMHRKVEHRTSWGHLYKDFFSPFQGTEVFVFSQKYFWQAKLLGKIEGEAAKRAAEFIEKSPSAYPYCEKYILTGPNSNTFAQWVLNQFPEFTVALPGNCIGKKYQLQAFPKNR